MTPKFFFALLSIPVFSSLLHAADTEAESAKLSRWALDLPDAQPSATPNSELRAARDAARAEPARLIRRDGGTEVWARELGDGTQVVALINREGRKPELDLSKAAFASSVVTMKSGPVKINIPLNGARKLYLSADNSGDGDSGDHADWLEPRLTGPTEK